MNLPRTAILFGLIVGLGMSLLVSADQVTFPDTEAAPEYRADEGNGAHNASTSQPPAVQPVTDATATTEEATPDLGPRLQLTGFRSATLGKMLHADKSSPLAAVPRTLTDSILADFIALDIGSADTAEAANLYRDISDEEIRRYTLRLDSSELAEQLQVSIEAGKPSPQPPPVQTSNNGLEGGVSVFDPGDAPVYNTASVLIGALLVLIFVIAFLLVASN
jgi:hypothetical protein